MAQKTTGVLPVWYEIMLGGEIQVWRGLKFDYFWHPFLLIFSMGNCQPLRLFTPILCNDISLLPGLHVTKFHPIGAVGGQMWRCGCVPFRVHTVGY